MVEKTPTAPLAALEHDLGALEARLAALVAHVHELRSANAGLRRDLAVSVERNRALNDAVEAAAGRIDALLERLPEAAE